MRDFKLRKLSGGKINGWSSLPLDWKDLVVIANQAIMVENWLPSGVFQPHFQPEELISQLELAVMSFISDIFTVNYVSKHTYTPAQNVCMDELPVFMLFLERRRTENWEDLQKYWLHSREIYNIRPASHVGVDEARSPTTPVSIHDNDRPVMLGIYLNMITTYNLSQFHPLWEVPEDSGMVTERDQVKVPIYI
ncbi:hypothetical protein CIHG_06279 [Coccidioides immitis H538.4]|uniref:Uncharacterized protein n=1 Tax=Coccidioides immitis H538.4 TaxID=396776 RepID=A0A0J8RWH7_COCIT|nr:hypothetical protein CIHG_06279 [Coccidioides immitis H538.4]